MDCIHFVLRMILIIHIRMLLNRISVAIYKYSRLNESCVSAQRMSDPIAIKDHIRCGRITLTQCVARTAASDTALPMRASLWCFRQSELNNKVRRKSIESSMDCLLIHIPQTTSINTCP